MLQCQQQFCMKTSPSDTTALNKFLRYLNRNKMGQSFFRYVSTSLEKTLNPIYDRRYKSIETKHHQHTRTHTLPSKKRQEPNQTVTSFNINESPLGHSVRLLEHPFSHNPSPSPSPSPSPIPHNHLLRTRQLTFRDRLQMSKMNAQSDKPAGEAQLLLRNKQQLLKKNEMEYILTTLTGNPYIAKLRIYKEKMRKFYNARYGREKLTTFLDYEYIEDVDTQTQYLQTLLSLSLQEIHFLCFIVLDVGCDGLVCNDDLFNIATVSAEQNPLLNSDIFRIFHYIGQFQDPKTSTSIIDVPNDDDPAKDPAVTLQKYKLFMLKSEKKTLEESDRKENRSSLRKSLRLSAKTNQKGVVLSRKVNRHLFSLKSEEEQGAAAIKQLRKKFAQTSLQSQSHFKFKINFQRFTNIFRNSVPETFYDLLFIQGGVRLQGKSYCPIKFDFQQVQKKEVIKQDVNWFIHYQDTVNKMRETFRRSRIEKFNEARIRIYRST